MIFRFKIVSSVLKRSVGINFNRLQILKLPLVTKPHKNTNIIMQKDHIFPHVLNSILTY